MLLRALVSRLIHNPGTPLIMATLTNYDKKENEAVVSAEAGLPEYDLGNTIDALVAEDHEHEIKLRTMSWQKAAWLLAGDQVCLAIMAQSWSLSYVQ